MIDKLKILKDIKIRRPKGLDLPYLDWYREEVKKEMIKWVKELDKFTTCYGEHEFFGAIENNGDAQLILKKFANITSEDLA